MNVPEIPDLPQFTFDPCFRDGSPRRLAGTWQPTPEQALATIHANWDDYPHSWPSDAGTLEQYLLRQGWFTRAVYHIEPFERALTNLT